MICGGTLTLRYFLLYEVVGRATGVDVDVPAFFDIVIYDGFINEPKRGLFKYGDGSSCF